MRFYEFILSSTLALLLGMMVGYAMFSYKAHTQEYFYIEQCLANNKTDYLDTIRVNHCTHSFEVFKVKR